MVKIKQFKVNVETDQLIHLMKSARSADKMASEIDWAVKTINRVAAPVCVYDYFTVGNEGEGQARIEPQTTGPRVLFNIGPKAQLLTMARLALVAVITLGPELDGMLNNLQHKGDMLKAYILDTAGILALGLAGRRANRIAEDEASNRNWGVGRRLSPGDLRGWDVEEQRKIAKLLPLSKIGVTLTSGCMLRPVKTGTSIIGLGPSYKENRVGTVCQWCPNQKSCLIRRLEEMDSYTESS